MSDYYDGDDRTKQVDAIRDMAAAIAFSSDDPTLTARRCVNYFVANADLPEWFDDHDHELLVTWVKDTE